MKRLLNNGTFSLLLNSIEKCENISVFGLGLGEKLAIADSADFLFYVVDNIDNIDEIYDKFVSLGRTVEVLTDSITPFSSEFVNVSKYLSVLHKMYGGDINTLIITPEVLAGFFPRSEYLQTLNLKVGDSVNIANIVSSLQLMNYNRVEMVSEPNDFSVRGDIIDVYPSDFQPVRIFVDYDNIESIKCYNPVTMLTSNSINHLEISASSYVLANKEEVEKLYSEKKLVCDQIKDELMECRTNDYRRMFFCLEKYSPILNLVDNAMIVFDGAKVIFDKLESYIKDYNDSLKNLEGSLKPIAMTNLLDIKKILKFNSTHTLIAYHLIVESNRLFSPQKVFSVRTLPSVNYYNYKDAFLLDINNFKLQNYTVVLCIGNEENVAKYIEILDKNHLQYNVTSRMSTCYKGEINLLTKEYPLDIILPDEKLAIISSISLLGRKKKVKDIKVDLFDGDMPVAGDFVVHNFHGIGKCLGVETLKISNAPRDYVVVEYKGGDKLYLPVENIDQLSKFIGSDKAPSLNKIGGEEFARTKAKVKSAVKKIAFDLTNLYRERMALKGYKYLPDDEIQEKFENDFGYTETSDQLKAINDCKEDMQSGKVMDRLVCGDVGFGKTEVALRIAFKTIMNGKQVAFMCPTTILSEQHFATAKSRMSNFGVKVEVLNRLKSDEQVSKIKSEISSGKIDLICGTHKLLGSDIDYKKLGLLVLDEEQKFGVADKEKLKNLKKSINVLTLSATPIPRTLNMSLIGVRDISVIETPPVARISTEVQIVEYSDGLVKTAIERELSRDGQVLIIYNRVETIYQFSAYLRNMVPNVNISVAHGQMTSNELEAEIYKLYTGKTQILVSTTLIENGVDLPNANTLIIINADKLGLSQLYQLKGRIGRSTRSSYAYFTFDGKDVLSENAYKRLQAIQEFSEMGSGFKIAMRDLEIRGAGSLLGCEQSGHIEKIGYNLYVQILNDSIRELSHEQVTSKSDVRIETNYPAYLSHNYVESSVGRMKLYRDISTIDSDTSYQKTLDNITEIYGNLPDELINLMKVAYIKNLAINLNATKISIKDESIIYLKSREDITKKIVDLIVDKFGENVTLNFKDMPSIQIKGIEKTKMLDFLITFLQLILTN